MTIEHDELDKEWDSRSHTPDEYRREIRELRDRCAKYAQELTELREELVREQYAHLTALMREQRAHLAAEPTKPSGYAYRYADGVLRLNDGSQFNGGWPVEAVPYWFAPYWFAPPALAAEPTKPERGRDWDDGVLEGRLREREYWLAQHTAPPAAAPEPTHPGYVIGNHWLETAYSRVCAGEAEADVLRDIGLVRVTDAEALRRDAESWRKSKEKYTAWQKGTDLLETIRLQHTEIERLKADNDALRRDAERWKHHRSELAASLGMPRELVDAIIDAAMKGDKT